MKPLLGFFGGVVMTLCVLAVAWHATSSEGQGLPMGTTLTAFGEEKWCELKNFRNVAMKTVLDATIFGLLADIKSEQKFEASGVLSENHTFYVICDSSWSIPAFHDLSASGSFDFFHDPKAADHKRWANNAKNYLIAPADLEAFPHSVDSNWESITYHGIAKQHIVTQESLVLKDGKFHAVIMNVDLHHDTKTWTLAKACRSEFSFKDDSKGFEGMLGVEGIDGRFFLLGLCEGNWCDTGAKGKELGHGRLVIMELEEGEGPPNTFKDGYLVETSTCQWKTVRVVDIPATANFQDYSDVARLGKTIAISSQETSALFFGEMTLKDGLLDPDTFEITGGQVTRFAPTPTCRVQYCNVEGIEFLSDRLLIGGSDSMKGGARQPFTCLEKDQSMHVFALPNKVELEL
jgi:hypothetical protein